MDLIGFNCAGSCGEYTSPRSDERSTPKEWIGGNTNVGPVLEVKVTYHLYQHGIEIKIDSMKNDGCQSWIVISRGMNKYVNELPEENGKSIHCEEETTSVGRPFATKQKEQSTPPLLSLSTIAVPIHQRKWKDSLAVDYVDNGSVSFSVSKTMTRILRHRRLHREADGAMEWTYGHQCDVATTRTP